MADKLTKLSDAIRLGATFHPQCFNASFKHDQNMEIIATCAVGAAREAMGLITEIELIQRFNLPCDILGFAASLNDGLLLTREEIADHIQARGY